MPRINPKDLPPRYQQQIAAQCAVIAPQAARIVEPKQSSHDTKYAKFIPMCEQFGMVAPVAEYRFHPERRWRFDFAWPQYRIALEVEGGVWSGGRHTRGSGFVADMEKYNEAAILQWLVLRVTPQQLMKRDTVDMVGRCLASK